METLAIRLAALMAAKQLGQRTLATLAGVKHTAVHRWVTGLTTNPGRDDLAKVAKVLGVTPLFLRTGEGPLTLSPGGLATTEDFEGAAEKAVPYTALDLALLKQVLQEVLGQAPNELPERMADVATKAYDTALRTRRLDRVAEFVRTLLS